MFCLQEGISNALRHGKANLLTLTNEEDADGLVIDLIDNGIGIQEGKLCKFGSGLKGTEDRLTDFNGTVKLISSPTGCTLKLRVEDCYD